MAAAFIILPADNVRPQELVRAESLCENNGGVDLMEYDLFTFDVFCKDGAEFKEQPQHIPKGKNDE